jgi:hypothetical protein
MTKAQLALAYLERAQIANGAFLAKLLQVPGHQVSAYMRPLLRSGIVQRETRYGGTRGHYRIYRLIHQGAAQ